MIVVVRFRVPESGRSEFLAVAAPAVELLRTQPGLESLDFGVNLDDPELWALVARWRDVGSYRRALGTANRPIIWPLLALAVDEPTVYGDPADVGRNIPATTDRTFPSPPTRVSHDGPPAGWPERDDDPA